MNKLEEKYIKEIRPALQKELGLDNLMAVPKIEKVSVNVGLSRGIKGEQNFVENVESDLKLITGQAPVKTQARKAISGFKIREGQSVGMTVTLRGQKMWDFVYKLIGVTIPRMRDFQGIKKSSFDQRGNLSLGIKEQLIFPEISADEVNTIFGLQVNVTTTAEDKESGLALLRALGFPIEK